MAIIGFYDLSPARVLDMILDAFFQNLVGQWRFFLELLECTPWTVRNLSNKRKAKAMATDISDTEFAGAMGLERGNLILTQVLGFKFSAYQVRPSLETYRSIWLTFFESLGAGYGPERGYKGSRSNSERVDAGHSNLDKTSIRADTRHHALRTPVFPTYMLDRVVDGHIYAHSSRQTTKRWRIFQLTSVPKSDARWVDQETP